MDYYPLRASEAPSLSQLRLGAHLSGFGGEARVGGLLNSKLFFFLIPSSQHPCTLDWPCVKSVTQTVCLGQWETLPAQQQLGPHAE